MTSKVEMTPGEIWRADDALLTRMLDEATASERRRTHLLIHDGQDDQVQRLLIAAANGTFVRPHVHSEQWEVLTILRGRGRLLKFSPDGRLEGAVEMAPDAASVVQIPPGTVHGFVVVENGAVVMEVKPGPYRPNEFVDWGPEEGSDAASRFVDWSAGAEVGERWTGA